MPRNCRCGGRLVPQKGTPSHAKFRCDGCGKDVKQPKRAVSPQLYIYVLKAKARQRWGSYENHVVRARTPQAARQMCPIADEGPIWVDPELTSCIRLGRAYSKTACVVLSDFKAG